MRCLCQGSSYITGTSVTYILSYYGTVPLFFFAVVLLLRTSRVVGCVATVLILVGRLFFVPPGWIGQDRWTCAVLRWLYEGCRVLRSNMPSCGALLIWSRKDLSMAAGQPHSRPIWEYNKKVRSTRAEGDFSFFYSMSCRQQTGVGARTRQNSRRKKKTAPKELNPDTTTLPQFLLLCCHRRWLRPIVSPPPLSAFLYYCTSTYG